MNTLPHHDLNGNPYTVYALIDPRDNAIRYVGITYDVYERFKQHIRCDGCNMAKDTWITELKIEQCLVIMQSLEQVETLDQALVREEYWIQHYVRLGMALLNAEVNQIQRPVVKKSEKKLTVPSLSPGRSGRERNFADSIDMLVSVRETGEWPGGTSSAMKQYYRREYPEFFRNGNRWAKIRDEKIRKASQLKTENRPPRRLKKSEAAREEGA